ncbi:MULTISPECIES: Pls/PosA family non-ribosomal peptide synthetase [unclassified Pseudomonas]|uniref:Pls/PosA family non-ribosomal peptide synthetase n=1 Tax=unclassified Pseudomonas TaxID=196821 RepID=UPI002AC994F1|nr:MULTISPECIES: Pls/PosA family non-ribosomal peptide synthetase [unclassified Pseudomonas]MEB0045634.1 non-ribosomal peptide synthetase [Pseudomonas sp. Dout3]MEB0095517.1 non-ribosomal peptide synthetase [Pseudomonas sp. DC1.2]WPX61099.1 non-ribosomal peptide synthetase [Pseudomonas sp. DC1.2]
MNNVTLLEPSQTEQQSDVLYGPIQPELLREEVLADLLEASARRNPDQVALIFGERQLSYGELNRQADKVASALIQAGVQPGHIVGLWLPRGIELLVMQAGIAKAGAAWLPLDQDTPVERLHVCMDDANAAGVVCCESLVPALSETGLTLWTAEALLAPTDAALVRRCGALPEHPAYVIYTSGSTGKPKGILISQRSICHFLRSENAILGISASDRVYQGFSVAFDMSFEEIWIAYLVGATLWIGPKEASGDPEILPRLLNEQAITVLHAVPTLLALFSEDVAGLRLINLGGEMCPESLVERWAKPGRQIFNTYGPTEATVSASLARLAPGRPVTIGTPLPNYGLLVIANDAEVGVGRAPALLPRGETGELCIIGPGLAEGYLGRPDLTEEKFLPNPWASGYHDARLYRTGDLARIDHDGQVQCLGRADDQVKIRGFRVELGEIEALLAQQPGVGTVAVLLRNEDGIDQLIAYLVCDTSPPSGFTAQLRKALSAQLPPYMVPGRFELLDSMPRLTSGKIDRKALKARPLSVDTSGADLHSDVAQNAGETVLFAALAALFPGQPIRRDADFFTDLGGHSFFAARLASALRTDPRFAHITVRDIYQQRRIGAIAAVLELAPQATDAPVQWTPPSAWRRWRCGVAQALALPVMVSLRMTQWLAPFFTYHFLTGSPGDSIALATGASVAVFLLATVLQFFIALAGKWLIAGRLKPGVYPLWGMTYFRWWTADRMVESAPVYLLSGSSLYLLWLRALGAKVGQQVIVGGAGVRAPDLLEIGSGVSIGNSVSFENARVERGQLHLGRITLQDNACVGSYVIMEGNTTVGPFGHLEGQSALADGHSVPAGRIWQGSPARDIGTFDTQSLPPRPAVTAGRLRAERLFFVFGILLIATLFFIPVFPTFILIDWFDEQNVLPWLQDDNVALQLARYFVLAFPASAVLIVATALASSALRWIALPRLKPGRYPVHSNTYCAKWLVSHIQEASLNVLSGIYATVYAPFWYRLLGAKVGRDAEISSAQGVIPDMLTLGDETFIADAVMLGDEHIDGGWMSMRPTVISNRSFVGNGSYIPDGTVLPENVLIGVHSSAPRNSELADGDTWLGSPPINLPAREQVSGYPESLTFHPSPLRRLARGLIEGVRIVTPHAAVIAVGYTVMLDLMPLAGEERWGAVLGYLALIGMAYGVGNFLFVVALKWLVMGRYRKRADPMWTPFVWLSEGITSLYEGMAVPNFMRYLRGTPWLPHAFNLLGCKIGRGVYMDTTDITEFDCVTIGADSELNAGACPQTHLFEDRVMKIDHVTLGERVYMGPRSCVLYSAEVGKDAHLGPLTLVMKGEHIPAASRWAGCPAAPGRA